MKQSDLAGRGVKALLAMGIVVMMAACEPVGRGFDGANPPGSQYGQDFRGSRAGVR